MIQVPKTFEREATDALWWRLGEALGVTDGTVHPDWDSAEAAASALVDLAQTFTKPRGPNA